MSKTSNKKHQSDQTAPGKEGLEGGKLKTSSLNHMERRKKIYASYGYDIEKERLAVIEAAGPLSGRILEAGTGKGHFAVALARLGYRLVSFDLSEEQLRVAGENLASQGLSDRVELRKENGESLSFPDASFDAIFSVNMVHHLENPLQVLRELTRVLKPGGKLVISDFSPEGLAMMAEVHRKEGNEHQEAPVGLDEVESFLKQEGFLVFRSRTRFQITLLAIKK